MNRTTTRRTRRAAIVAAGVAALLSATTASALAQDSIEATDGSGDVLTNQGSTKNALDFGVVCAGAAPTFDVTLAIVRDTAGGDATDFADTATVEVADSHTVDASTTATDTVLSPGAAADIVLPADWQSQSDGFKSAPSVSTVTLQAGTVLGGYLAELRYTATGPNANNGNDRSTFTKFDVTATIVHCVEGRDAPAIANEYLRERSTTDDCRDNVGTNKNKSNWHGVLISAVAHEYEDEAFTEEEVEAFVESACTAGLSS